MLSVFLAALLGAPAGQVAPLPYKCTFYVADVQYVSDPYPAAYRDQVKIWLRLDPRKIASTVFVLERPDFADSSPAGLIGTARYNAAVTAYMALLTRGLGRTDIGVEPDIKYGQTGNGTDSNPYRLGSLSMGAGSQIGQCNLETARHN